MARPLSRNVSGIFVVQILEDFAGDFPGGFFWALFPTKMRRKNPATESAKKSGGPKQKSAKNPFCQNPTLKSLNFRGRFCGHHSSVHFREHFRERVRGLNFAVRVLCAFLIHCLHRHKTPSRQHTLSGYPLGRGKEVEGPKSKELAKSLSFCNFCSFSAFHDFFGTLFGRN